VHALFGDVGCVLLSLAAVASSLSMFESTKLLTTTPNNNKKKHVVHY